MFVGSLRTIILHSASFMHAIHTFLMLKMFVISFYPISPARRTVPVHHAARRSIFRGVWYEHDVTSDDEAEENQGSIAEDQDGEGSGDGDELEESYDESD